MKKIVYIFALTVFSFATAFAQAPAEEIADDCNSAVAKKNCKQALDPYSYDASKTTKILFKDKPQMKELEIPLFIGEKYRLVFDKSGLPEDVVITIFDKKWEAKNRTALFTTKGSKETLVTFEPEKSRKLFIDYEIPPSADGDKKGCVVFVLGYMMKGEQ